ncbi:hypothetical protein IW138_005632 [Coemansia sp. RSA 986]|nr:hypothetical protein IW138_005632 [Coemansia sp. RSA 986]
MQRLRRKLRRFLLHKRTAAKLEAMWELYQAIKQSAKDWRLDNTEVLQFLGAILRAGDRGDVWSIRALRLADHEGTRADAGADAAVILALLRIHAKFSDLAGFEKTVANRTRHKKGAIMRHMVQDDFYETKAIALARAGLPKQAEKTLLMSDKARLTPESCAAFQRNVAEVNSRPGQHVWTRPVPPGIVALREILLAWARDRNVDRAWGTIDQLMMLGYVQSPREWNALLHMHALDPRYQYELLERVLERMRAAGVKKDHATYNIMMQGCLLRGLQMRWRDWLKKMQGAGHEPDVYTYATLAGQLVATGQWSEALRIIDAMKTKAKTSPTTSAGAESTVAMMRIERQRNQTAKVMSRFRENVFHGRHISVREFTLVAAAALDCPAQWTTEIALLIQCLEDGCIEESAVADSLAARLPGLDDSRIKERPLLRVLRLLGQDDTAAAAAAAAAAAVGDSIVKGIDCVEHSATPTDNAGFISQLAATGSSEHKRVPGALDAILQSLLRNGSLEQAERLIHATRNASIDVSAPSTLLSILYHMLRLPGTDAADAATHTLTAMRFVPPTLVPAALLVACIKNEDLEAAHEHFAHLEWLVEKHPSVRAFNALLYYAQKTDDTRTLESKWQQMETLGLVPDAMGHHTRIMCYSRVNDMLHTRRAYSDMLDYGYPPTFPAVSSMVRCCVRCGEIDLALTVIRHAEQEHGAALNTTTYNYMLSRLAAIPGHEDLVRSMFASMLGTPDSRLRSELSDVIGSVAAKKLRFSDLRVFGARDGHQKSLAAWLLRPEKVKMRPTKSMKRALAQWLTSKAAFPAAPTLFDEQAERDEVDMMATASDKLVAARRAMPQGPGDLDPRAALPAPPPTVPPPPNATTFIILLRSYGQREQWQDVVDVWNAMHRFNKRVAGLQAVYPQAARNHIVLFSRMVGWVALAFVRLGRRADAQRIWDAAAADGVMSPSAIEVGMDEMLTRLPIPRRLMEDAEDS